MQVNFHFEASENRIFFENLLLHVGSLAVQHSFGSLKPLNFLILTLIFDRIAAERFDHKSIFSVCNLEFGRVYHLISVASKISKNQFRLNGLGGSQFHS